eukprot:jgi/Ulvmu1/3446/UM016_0065.1
MIAAVLQRRWISRRQRARTVLGAWQNAEAALAGPLCGGSAAAAGCAHAEVAPMLATLTALTELSLKSQPAVLAVKGDGECRVQVPSQGLDGGCASMRLQLQSIRERFLQCQISVQSASWGSANGIFCALQ